MYQYSGRNFAPAQPLKTLSEPVYEPNKLTEAMMGKYQDFMARDQEVWYEQYDTGQMVANKRKGKLMLLRNSMTGAYMFVKRDGRWSDRKALGGVVQFYSSKLLAGWLSSRPEIDPVCQSDNDQIDQFVSDVKVVQDHYNKKFFTNDYETLEAISAQDYGTWVTRFWFCPYEKDIVCELLDFPACRWDIRKRAEESSYFIYDSRCSNAELERMLNADIAPDDGDSALNYGLRKIREIATSGGNVVGQGKGNLYGNWTPREDENVVTQMWLKPEAYADIELTADEETLCGVSIPKDGLLEMFPEGMCVVGIDGMSTIIGIYAENHSDHIVSGLYHTQSYSGVGKGISDIIDTSKEMDDLFSQILAYVKGHTMPSWGFNADVVTEDKVRQIGQGRKAIALDFSQAPEARNVNDVIQHLVPGNPGSAAFDMWEKLNDNAMIASQVTNFSNAFPGVQNTTATGAKIGDANAQMLLVPQLLNKASHRQRAFKVIFNLFKKFVDKEKFFSTKTANPITAGKYLTGSQFEDIDVEFEIVANSEIPVNPLMQKEGLQQLFQYTGGAAGLMQMAQMDPDMTGRIVNLFAPGTKLPIPSKDDIARVCRSRVEQAKQILETELRNQEVMAALGMPADNTDLPMAVVSQLMPPISPQERYAEQKAAWLAELLDADELQFAPIELRYVIEAMIKVQLGAAVLGAAQLQQAQTLGNVIAEMPMYVGQQAMSRENQALQMQMSQQEAMAQQQQQQQQMAGQLQLEQEKARISEEQAKAQHQRNLAESDDAQQKALQLQALQMLGQERAPA